jgi:hypothetical protein
LYLSEKFDCQDVSPFYSVGDLLEIKKKRFLKGAKSSNNFWSLLEITGVPDLARLDLSYNSNFDQLLKIASTKNAIQFREWFHTYKELSEKEFFKEYIAIMNQVPIVQRLPSKVLRFVITTGFGLIPGLGQAVSMFDSFIVDKLFRGRTPKFFIDELTKITGSIRLQQ